MIERISEGTLYEMLLSISESSSLYGLLADLYPYRDCMTVDEQVEVVQRIVRYFYCKGLIEFYWDTVKEVWPKYVLLSGAEIEQVFNERELWYPPISDPVKLVDLSTTVLGDKYLNERLIRDIEL